MTVVNVHEAKTHLSHLLAQVAKGEEIIIARAGKPIARLTSYQEKAPKRRLGRDRGLFEVPEDFNTPLPEEILHAFEQPC